MEITKHRTKCRRDGLIMLLLGAIFYSVVGLAWSRVSRISSGDFKVVYYSSRSLLEGGDPYNQGDVLKIYEKEGRELGSEPALDREVKTRFFYPPTAFIMTVPIALLGFGLGKIVWMVICSGTFILSGFLIWEVAADYAPRLSGLLVGLLLANSFWLLMIGNSAAIAVSLCIIATWCFCRDRLGWVGVLCLALSLALKPNDSGLVWLFFLLAGSTLRKRALQSVAVLIVISLPFFIWVSRVSPHWLTELRTNMASFSGAGGIVDPGLTGMAGKNMDCIVQLQTAVSVFFSDPRTWSLITWCICAPLALIWAFRTFRSRPTGTAVWLGLAAAAPLTVLPTYHFQHDAKLLLIAIPGCALLWEQLDRIGKLAFAVTIGAIFINGDIFSGIRILLTRGLVVPHPTFISRLTTLVFTRPGPIVLLLMAVFYLWVYLRREEPSPRIERPVTSADYRAPSM